MYFSGISYADYPDTKKNRSYFQMKKERFLNSDILNESLARLTLNIVDACFSFGHGSFPVGALLTGKCCAFAVRF